jgi:Zn-dependent protease
MDFGHFDMRVIVVGFITLLLSICVHEFGHAFVADRLGDSLPRRQGRVTLNPLAHADLIGTVALPLLMLATAGYVGFGWGKPVMVQPAAMTRKLRMRTAHLLVALAGPVMNVLLAIVVAALIAILLATHVLDPSTPILGALLQMLQLNCLLACFNLLPVPPLDGGTVLEGFLPASALEGWSKFKPYGWFVFLAFIAIPQLRPIYLVPAGYLLRGIAGLFGLA